MASGRYSRIDNNRRQSSNYCSTVTIVVFVALCLVGVWMMTSSSAVPSQNVDVPAEENRSDVKDQVIESNQGNTKQFEDNPGDLPADATKGENTPSTEEKLPEENLKEKAEEKPEETLEESPEEKPEGKPEEHNESDNGLKSETQAGESNDKDERSDTQDGNANSDAWDTKPAGQGDSSEGEKKPGTDSTETKPDGQGDSIEGEKNPGTDETDMKPDGDSTETKPDGYASETKDDGSRGNVIEEKLNQKNKKKAEAYPDGQPNRQDSGEFFPSGSQSEFLNETTTQSGSWSTQAAESKNEKETQLSSNVKQEYNWKLCNSTAGPDYIPCLDNWQAIKSLRSTKHYEHRERHCPEEPPTCLVPLPEGYRRPIEWPKSREKIWYYNVPHTKLADLKGHQNWVKVTGEYLTFPGGGTQFKHGALHYIDFIAESVPDVAWGKRTRVILDVGCGVASFGGYLFDRDVLAMSFAPKDEHEAQVQFALERGIPALSAVMGTKRLPFPGQIFDAVHCARCRVPWHIEGGKLLLELNRMLRPGGFFIWSATPVYQKLPDDVEIWNAMKELTKAMCWEMVSINKDTVNGVGVATYRKPSSNDCYEKRSVQEPPICKETDDLNAAWYVPLQACMHKIPVDPLKRGSQWPQQWPVRLDKAPDWLLSSQVGVYGKPEPQDFASDYEHWKRVVSKSYLNGLGINWMSVRNVMDMRSIYGGFAAALRDMSVWVMNVVPTDSPDTLPIIYERGLLGIYHDWCESFSTYPRSYDLLHADHLFSKIKKKCNLVAVVAEVDRILRPEGKLIVRDDIETIGQLENMLRSMQWKVRMTYSKDKEGLLCVQKSMWRPKESETITYAIA